MTRDEGVTVEAPDVEQALARAAAELQCDVKELRHTVLRPARSGILGLFARPARIRAWRHSSVARQVESVLRSVRNLDGHYLVEIKHQDLVLTVFPPLGLGRRIDEEELLTAVREYEPASLDEEAVRSLAATADGKPHVVGRLLATDNRDGTFTLTVAQDRMSAELLLQPPRRGGREVTLAMVETEIKRQGIVNGLNVAVIKQALEERRFNMPLIVATGMPPGNGADGRLEYRFRTDRHVINFREDDKGRVNFKELDLIESVSQGQVLVRRVPPGAGRAGRDVFGREIPAQAGRNVELPAGKNVYRDGDELKSAIDGHVTLTGRRVNVSPIFHVRGDVNFAVGNIDFDGTVRVDGLVEDGFVIRCRGSAFVRKSLGKCRVEIGENLVVIGGILGRYEADVRAGGDLVALFIENSHVFAGGNLTVGELILHSDVMAGGDILMNGARGALIGGSAVAGGNVVVRAIGGEGTSRTNVTAGVNPELADERREVERKVREEEEKLGKVTQALEALRKAGTRSEEAAGQEAQLVAGAERLRAQVKALRVHVRDLEERIATEAPKAVISVSDTAMACTRIEIAGAWTILNAPTRFVTFYKVGNEIKMEPFREPAR